MASTYRHSQVVQSGSQAPDIDAHLQQWAEHGWSLAGFSSSATMTPGGLAMGGLRVFYDFIWKYDQ